MNRNIFWGTVGLGLLLILMGLVSQQEASSINSVQPQAAESQNIADRTTTETQMSQLASASNRFGFNLFSQIQDRQPGENIVISPKSIAIALAMVRKGTEDETREEMTTALELDLLDSGTVDASYLKLIEALKTADPDVTLAIANSLWVNQNITLKEEFINGAKEFYQAQVSNLDFADPQAKDTINNWVAQNTANKIPQIVDSVSVEDAIYLINAIYIQNRYLGVIKCQRGNKGFLKVD